jgi:hypothetical protein
MSPSPTSVLMNEAGRDFEHRAGAQHVEQKTRRAGSASGGLECAAAAAGMVTKLGSVVIDIAWSTAVARSREEGWLKTRKH